jgi:hypothetical protein
MKNLNQIGYMPFIIDALSWQQMETTPNREHLKNLTVIVRRNDEAIS